MQATGIPHQLQRRVPRSLHNKRPHAGVQRSPNLARIVAQEQPLLRPPLRIRGQDGPIARTLGLRAGSRRIEVARQKRV